jgi:hypothetical protein
LVLDWLDLIFAVPGIEPTAFYKLSTT